MNKPLKELLESTLKSEAESVRFTEMQSSKILKEIHQEVNRRKFRMLGKGKRILIAAAAIAVLGTVTVIGAGKVVGLSSSTNLNEVTYKTAADVKEAADIFGAVPKAPEKFSNGLTFTRGFLEKVEGHDEFGTVVYTYDDMALSYENGISLHIRKFNADDSGVGTPVSTAEIQGIETAFYEDQYLFLPPDAEPSEADLALEKEGRLYISYGTAEEERQVYRYVLWQEDGLAYSLSTFDESYTVDDLNNMVHDIIAVK